jgi:Ca-activated chloride channel family protein
MPGHIQFLHPYFLFLLLLLPLLSVWYYFRHRNSHADIQISSLEAFKNTGKSLRQRLYISLFVIRLLVLALLIIAIARPQSHSSKQDVSVTGIDIVLATDISGSMLAEDFKPNRLEAAKDVASDFIEGRPNDRIGLVVFSGESFTQCPLTSDHSVLINLFRDVKSGMIDDGTALGDGLATAVDRLRNSKAVSKVVILLTDGVNNMGSLDPMSAAEIAKLYKIRIYTIGVGTMGMAPYPVQTPFGIQYQEMEVNIDEPLLKNIAGLTNGEYFRATNKQKLAGIYKEIDQMEKSKIDVTEFRKKKEEFLPFALLALVLLIAEGTLRNTVFKTIP